MEKITNKANLTFAELKQKIDSTKALKKAPTAKALLTGESPIVVSKTMIDGSRLTAFKNGFALYQTSRFYTVIRVDQCGNYTHPSHTGPICFVADYFADRPWSLRLQLEAEDQIVQNQKSINMKWYASLTTSMNYERIEDKKSLGIGEAAIEVYETECLLETLT